jgi:hypothetical protein
MPTYENRKYERVGAHLKNTTQPRVLFKTEKRKSVKVESRIWKLKKTIGDLSLLFAFLTKLNIYAQRK